MSVEASQRFQGRWPAEVTSFVGRRLELDEIRRALSSSRLVSLVGAGGVGKTRLAFRAAWDLRRTFPDGVWLVELVGLEDEGLVAQAVVTALGIQDRSTLWTAETVAEHVADRQLLLVLDNCEHVVQTCAITVATLMERCPNLRVLTTTRQAFGIAGERILPVPALRCPEPDAPMSPPGLMAYEAVALFTDRAKAVVPDFSLDERTGPLVCGVCRRLDGIPLAIELAAFSLRVLSPDQILQRLDDRFSLLTAGNRAALPRHQTLRALIDWSFELCLAREKIVWARASVFAEHFDLESAEIVCSGAGLPEPDVMSAIAGLVDKSILIRDERDGQVRFRFLETIREYGREVLRASGQESQVRRRHQQWCLGLVERMQQQWFGPEQASWFVRMRTEHANVRTALEFCLSEPDEISVGMRVVDSLREYWRVSGLISEGRRWCDRLLERGDTRSESRLRLLISASYLALLQSDLSTGAELIEEARRLAHDLGDETGSMLLHVPEALAAALQRDFPGAVTTCEQAIDELRESGDLPWLSTALAVLGMSCSLSADPERTTAYYNELLSLCRTHGEKWRQSYALWGLGVEAWRQGDTERATMLEKESLSIQREFNDLHCVGLCVEALAWIDTRDGHVEKAGRLFGTAETIRREAGGPLLTFFSEYHDQCVQQARRSLRAADYDNCFEQGASVRPAEAVAYVLGDPLNAKHSRKEDLSSPLSRRECEIAELVAQGMSNKQIATTLVISQRTAEAHVEHILAKLGFTSRAQVAAWVAEQRAHRASL